jgi:hypothetical protein
MATERTVIEAQVPNAGGESDIVLMENRGPLHWRTVQNLAIPAMADLGIDRIGADNEPPGLSMGIVPLEHGRLIIKLGFYNDQISRVQWHQDSERIALKRKARRP